MDEQIKLGARNSAADKNRIAAIRQGAMDICSLCDEMEPDAPGDTAMNDEMEPQDTVTKAGGLSVEQVNQAGPMVNVIAVKAAGDEWQLDILAAPFGGPMDKDSDGEYFAADTQFMLDRLDPVPVYYHGYDAPGQKSDVPVVLGRTVGKEIRADGVWLRVALDKANEYARRVWESAKRGMARASSGSISHLVRKGQDGKITVWPMAEISIFETETGKRPANKRAVAVPVMKAVYEQAGYSLPEYIEREAGDGEGLQGHSDGASTVTDSEQSTKQEHRIMEINEVNAAVEAALKARDEQAKAAAEAAKADHDRIEAEVEKRLAERTRLPGAAPVAAKFGNVWKYDNVDDGSLAVLVGLLREARKTGMSAGASDDAVKALAVRIADGEDKQGVNVRARQAMKAAGMPVKANELNQSTLASYGDEWVGVAYSTAMWERIRYATPVMGLIPTVEVPQGSESIVIPIEGSAPTFYKVAQASAQNTNTLGETTFTVTSSKFGTSNATLGVTKLGGRTIFTGELEEDSVLPWINELRASIEKEAAEVLEHTIIDGDTVTTATTNINCIGGTPAGTEAYLAYNGLRKLALVTNTANARSAGGSLAVTDFLETVKLLGLGGKNAMDRRAVKFVIDPWTNWKAMTLSAVQTRDVFSQPTLENGMLVNIFGYDVIVSGNVHRANQDATYGLKANTAGKVDLDTASNNTTGAIIAFRPDQWRLGWKRQIRFETRRIPAADATEIVVTMRVGLVYRDTEASAVTYNVGI